MKSAPKSSAEFECDCENAKGEKIKTTFDFVQPDESSPQLKDVRCRGCSAIWRVLFRRHPDGLIGFTFRLKEPSAKLGDFLRKKKIAKLTNAPQKKSPIWVVPGFKK